MGLLIGQVIHVTSNMPGVQDKPPTKQEVEEVRKKALAKLGEEGLGNFLGADIEKLKASDEYVGLFWKHVFDLPGDQGDEAAAMVVKTFKWRKEFGVDKLNENSVNKSVLNKGSFFTHNRDKDGMKLIVFTLTRHVKGEDNIDDVKKVLVYYLERLTREEEGKKISWVFDCKNAGLKNADLEVINFIIFCMEHCYPDILNYIYILDMPWILGAAFKVVKAALPAAGVAKLKDVNKSTFGQWVDDDNRLKSWGGNDDWEFKFEPEVIKKIKAETIESSPVESIYEEPTEIRRRKHPAPTSSRSTASTLSSSESERSLQRFSENYNSLLKVSPAQEIIFSPSSGGDFTARVQLTNSSDKIAAYKMKTTSPEKYRVRPSTGSLGQGQTITIEIHVSRSHVQNSASLLRDKFLITAITLDSSQMSPQIIQQLLKSGKSEAQYRLHCQLANSGVSQVTHLPNGSVPSDTSVDIKKEADKVMQKLKDVIEKQERLENQMMLLTYGGIGVLALNFFLLVLFLFFNSCPDLTCPEIVCPELPARKSTSFFG